MRESPKITSKHVVVYVHCFIHKHFLVVVHLIAAENLVKDSLNTSSFLYTFIRTPTASDYHQSETLKRLLRQRRKRLLRAVKILL